MSPHLRERLIALLENHEVAYSVTGCYGEIDGECCATCGAEAVFDSNSDHYVVRAHFAGCELQACLQELRALEPEAAAVVCRTCNAVMAQHMAFRHRCPPSNPF